MEAKTAQLRVKHGRNGGVQISEYGTSGTVFWTTPTRAKLLIDTGGFELVNAGPAEQPTAGPSETKPAEPLEKKTEMKPAAASLFPEPESSAAAPAGRSTDSATSRAPGKAALSSASAAALASPERKPTKPDKSARKRRSRSSR